MSADSPTPTNRLQIIERRQDRKPLEAMMRENLVKLADTLGADARSGVLAELTAIAKAEQASAEKTEPGQEIEGGRDRLLALTNILGRMSGLIAAQQHKMLKLLKEVQAASENKVKLAGLQQELGIARSMQLSILPRTAPDHPNFKIAATMVPAKEVGGDFYDYFLLDENRLAVVVADVSGKGVPAAFFMAISRTLLKSKSRFFKTASECIARLNDDLAMENEQMMFVTTFYGVLDLTTGQFIFVNAGHNPPVHITADGDATYLPKSPSMGLAVMEGIPFPEQEMTLKPGETLLLYTDGVTEATDINGDLFGEQRLLEVLQGTGVGVEVGTLPTSILREIHSFERGAVQADDITCVALRFG